MLANGPGISQIACFGNERNLRPVGVNTQSFAPAPPLQCEELSSLANGG